MILSADIHEYFMLGQINPIRTIGMVYIEDNSDEENIELACRAFSLMFYSWMIENGIEKW